MMLVAVAASVMVFLFVRIALNRGLGWMVFPSKYNGVSWQLVFVAQFFFTQVNNLVTAFLNGKKIFLLPFKIGVAATVLTVLLWIFIYNHIIALPLRPFGTVILISTGVLLLQALANLTVLFRNNLSFAGGFLNPRELRDVFKFAFFIYLCNSIQFLSYRMDLWFVDFYHGKADTGIYSLAVGLAQLVWILPNSIASVLYAYMSGTSDEEALYFLNRYMRISFYASLFISLGAFVFFSFAVPLIYGKAFTPSTSMIGILLVGIVPFSIPILCGSFFAGVQKVKYNLFASSIGFAVCLLLDVTLIPKFGALGACYATVLSYLASTLYCLYVVRFAFNGRLNLSPVRLLREDMKPIVLLIKAKLNLQSVVSKPS